MTVLELNQKKELLKEEEQQFLKKRQELKYAIDRKIENLVKDTFNVDSIVEGVTIEASRDRVYFRRDDQGYQRDLISLYFRSKDYSSNVVDHIQTSFYSTSSSSKFELERMVLIGEVGKMILEKGDSLLERYNHIILEDKDTLDSLNKSIWSIESDVTRLNDQIKDIEKQQLLDRLEGEGIKLIYKLDENTHLYRLPSIDLKFDYRINGVKSIKILNKTKSGKSATVQVQYVRRAWDDKSKKYFWKVVTEEESNVRMKNIFGFINAYASKISAS